MEVWEIATVRFVNGCSNADPSTGGHWSTKIGAPKDNKGACLLVKRSQTARQDSKPFVGLKLQVSRIPWACFIMMSSFIMIISRLCWLIIKIELLISSQSLL